MTADLLSCPFCGGSAERIDFGPGSGDNEGGSCIACTKCQSSGPVEFGYKENFVSNWNRRALSHAAGQEATTNPAEIDRKSVGGEAVAGQWDLVPSGFLIDGPNGTAMVFCRAFIEPKIAAICENNGDDPEDYTATELYMKAWRGRAVDMPTTPAQPPASAEVGPDAVLGSLPAPITNPEAWPPGYADGFNDCAQLAYESVAGAMAASSGRSESPIAGVKHGTDEGVRGE